MSDEAIIAKHSKKVIGTARIFFWDWIFQIFADFCSENSDTFFTKQPKNLRLFWSFQLFLFIGANKQKRSLHKKTNGLDNL